MTESISAGKAFCLFELSETNSMSSLNNSIKTNNIFYISVVLIKNKTNGYHKNIITPRESTFEFLFSVHNTIEQEPLYHILQTLGTYSFFYEGGI